MTNKGKEVSIFNGTPKVMIHLSIACEDIREKVKNLTNSNQYFTSKEKLITLWC